LREKTDLHSQLRAKHDNELLEEVQRQSYSQSKELFETSNHTKLKPLIALTSLRTRGICIKSVHVRYRQRIKNPLPSRKEVKLAITQHMCLAPFMQLILINQVGSLSEPFNNKFVSLSSAINILHVIRGSLKMTCCIVALGNEDVVIDTTLKWLIKWNWRSLCDIIMMDFNKSWGLRTMNFSSILPSLSKPAASSRWWFAEVSEIVETMAI